jgi:hypothetical protein
MIEKHGYASLPDRPEGGGKPTMGPDGPPLGCLSRDEVNTINGLTSSIAVAQMMGSHSMLEMVLDQMTDAGSHVAGHTLEVLVQGAGQVAADKAGLPKGMLGDTFVAAMPKDPNLPPDDLHQNAADWAVEFASRVLNRQFNEAMDHWGELVNSQPSWDEYSHAVMAVLNIVEMLVTGELVPGDVIPGIGQTFTLKV